jgi:hypothetical protein
MYALYLIALIPFLLGAVAYAYRKEIVWFEWLGSVLVGLLVAAPPA